METQINTGETQRRTKSRRLKPTSRTMCALALTAKEYTRMRRRARQESLPFAAWLRRTALKELRRKPSM
jgi:hypothetical protein